MAADLSAKASDWLHATHVATALAELRPIYMAMFPDRQITLRLRQGDSAIWADPQIHDHGTNPQPPAAHPETLAILTFPAPTPVVGTVTIDLAIPRAPTPAEEAGVDQPWQPERLLFPLWLISPMIYEQACYGVEMWGRKRASKRHFWGRLPAPPVDSPSPAARMRDKGPAILIGFHWLEVGGAEKMAFDTVIWALAAGLRVFVVASVPSLQRLSGRLPDHPNVTFLRLDRYLPHDHWPAFLETLIMAENIRLIHNHHCVPLYAALARLRTATPWVKVIDTTHIVEYADGGFPRISGVWSNFIDVHHVISRDLVSFFTTRFKATRKLCLGRMLSRKANLNLPAMTMVVGQPHLRVAFVGRMTYQKRPIVVVETLAVLSRWAKANGIMLTATMVGDGPFLPAVKQLLHRRGLSETVTLAPSGSDVPALLRASDILLLPSHNEGLALVCYEAIEQGCIPISTDVGAQHEIIPPDLCVPLEPRAALRTTVQMIDRLWRDPDFLARQTQALHQCYTTLAAEPTAYEVLSPIYQAAAQGREV